MHFVYGFIAGIFAGGVLSYFYAAKVIQDYKHAASTIGIAFGKVAGKVTALRKDL